MPPWDLTELEQNTGEDNLSSVVSSSGSRTGGLDCSVDLKLGGLGDFRVADKWKEQRRPFAMPMKMSATVPAGGQLKRPRVLSGGSQNVSCLVDGCRNDLSHCREYHRRHKMVEGLKAGRGGRGSNPAEHMGLSACMCGSGLPATILVQLTCATRLHMLRFVASRFTCLWSLMTLSEAVENVSMGIIGVEGSHSQTLFLVTSDSNWSTIIKSEEYTLSRHQPSPLHFINRAAAPPPPQHFCSSFTWSFKEGKQFPFLHDDEMVLSRRTTLEPISSAAESSNKKIILTNGLPRTLHSDCALSLLSSSTNAPTISLSQDIPVERIQAGDQPILSSLDYGIGLGLYSHLQATANNVSMTTGFLCSGIENEHVSTVLVSDAIEADLHCQRIFHVEGEGTSDRASHCLPFSWY
ncbi:Squamosa promoter-binding-like protein 18 [Dendrobium catenatum]|uniref:Squamosa promoter-binding-like protein 18 n=1 Tax=Dendrobium catenatum TaxID=906689 RepID=A0A2I0WU07_9ASPA|nr:Squamosa promoter-binding-like protein 18 [Dendrobium catenatum]